MPLRFEVSYGKTAWGFPTVAVRRGGLQINPRDTMPAQMKSAFDTLLDPEMLDRAMAELTRQWVKRKL
jgi:hypothetical protein